jgi:hypothetical protein
VKDLADSVQELMFEARTLPDGPAKVALVEEAVRLADQFQDDDLAYAARKLLLESTLMADHSDQMLVTFAWCLAKSDSDPDRFGGDSVLWEYRWVISVLPTFPDIPRTKIDEMLDDMIRRYDEVGASLRSVHLLRRKLGIDLGDKPFAADAAKKWKECRRDAYTDSHETELAFDVTYQCFLDRHKQLLEVARPFTSGQLRDDHFEGHVFCEVLYPLLREGKAKEAMAFHRRGYKLRQGNYRYVDSIAKHIQFLALTDNTARAVRLFEKHLPAALTTTNIFNRMWFFIDTIVLFDRLLEEKKKTIKLRIPAECDIAKPDGKYDVQELRDWVFDSAKTLSTKFDARNGTKFFTKKLNSMKKLQEWFTPCPIN